MLGFGLEEHLPETALAFWAEAATASARLEEAKEAPSYLARFASLAEETIFAAKRGDRFPAGPLFERVLVSGNMADKAEMVRKASLT